MYLAHPTTLLEFAWFWYFSHNISENFDTYRVLLYRPELADTTDTKLTLMAGQITNWSWRRRDHIFQILKFPKTVSGPPSRSNSITKSPSWTSFCLWPIIIIMITDIYCRWRSIWITKKAEKYFLSAKTNYCSRSVAGIFTRTVIRTRPNQYL